jgi:hypothetical protein
VLPVPLTVVCFAYAVLLAVMGWEIGAAIAAGVGVLNQALVTFAVAADPEPVPVRRDRIDTGEPTLPGEDDE